MTKNFVNTNYVVILQQQYTPRDRFLAIRKTASQGVSFALYIFCLKIQSRCIPNFI